MGPDLGRPIDINLLEEGEPRAGQNLGEKLFPALAVLAVAMLAPMILLLIDIRGDTTSLTRRLSSAQDAMKQLAAVPTEIVALRAELDAARRRLSVHNTDAAALAARRIPWTTALRPIWSETGPNVALTSVHTEARRVTLRGDANALSDISGYVDRLRSTGLFVNIVIEMVSSQGTPLPAPTVPTIPPTGQTQTPGTSPGVATPLPIPSRTPTIPSPPVIPPAPTTPVPPVAPPMPPGWYPQPTWTPLPTWTPQPTYTPAPTYTPLPTSTPAPTHTPLPIVSVRVRNVVFSPTTLNVGDTVRVEATIDNLGNVVLPSQDQRPPGYTYTEGEASPSGTPRLWRVAADDRNFALADAHRYRWGFGGPLLPGQSRQIIGYIRLTTPGAFVYCVGVVQEFVNWYARCEGPRTITVVAPGPTFTPTSPPGATPTRTPTACIDGYEPDDNYQQARVIGANSSLPQQHSLQVMGDEDWVKFAVVPNITYTLRTQDLRGGADTMITLYGLELGTLYPLAENDEDPANSTLVPPVVGASRISYRFTTTETTRFGTTFYARIRSPNPGNFGCGKTYNLRLTSGVASAPSGVHLARSIAPGSFAAPSDAAGMIPPLVQEGLLISKAQRVTFIITMELRGGGL
jgi:hypothetical protein